jgi:hypothetical protein
MPVLTFRDLGLGRAPGGWAIPADVAIPGTIPDELQRLPEIVSIKAVVLWLGWAMGIEPTTSGATVRCSAS